LAQHWAKERLYQQRVIDINVTSMWIICQDEVFVNFHGHFTKSGGWDNQTLIGCRIKNRKLRRNLLCEDKLSKHNQAIKYILQGRLTKCPMTLSLGRTYVWWCPMTFSSVWLWNKSEWRKLISALCINSELNVVKILNNLCHSYLFSSQN
jgi:hypothetical protein